MVDVSESRYAISVRVQRHLDVARTSWPSFPVSGMADYERYLTERSAFAKDEHAADLYLACACLHGVTAAVTAFDTLLKNASLPVIARVDRNSDFVDEVMQVLREKLLIGVDGRTPKLAQYQGRSALATWIRTVAARAALNCRRVGTRPHEALESGPQGSPSPDQPEREYAKAQCKREFRAALQVVLDSLAERDRALLSLHLVDGVSLERLAKLYGVSRATTARWMAEARKDLIDEMRKELCRRLRLSQSEYESIAAFVRSRMGTSVVELLREDSGSRGIGRSPDTRITRAASNAFGSRRASS